MIYLGIDPGKDGAIFGIGSAGVEGWIIPDLDQRAERMRLLLAMVDNCPDMIRAVLEDAPAFPGQSSVTTAAQFRDIGQWQGMLAALKIPYQMVKATTWQKEVMVGKPAPEKKPKADGSEQIKKERKRLAEVHRKEIKAYAATVAGRIFPGLDFRRTERCAGPHDGLVDAALIAEYCRRTWR
jgi:hypothetical protein